MKNIYYRIIKRDFINIKRDFININVTHLYSNAYEPKDFKRHTTLKFGRTHNGRYQYNVIKKNLTRVELNNMVYGIKRGYTIKSILNERK